MKSGMAVKSQLELLSPAGSMEALRAALANGADAVYLGAAAFGARASAGFDERELREALETAHLHRRKVYVTVNILIKERELADVRRTLSLLSSLRADAVLVQDLGVLKICREEFPEMPVHASTQMALHNAAGAALLRSLGAARAVMARECDLDALRRAAETGIEIEAFCHGALCVSCSGQCLFSSMIGGRSGNRGRCAQPCRLNYAYQGKTGAWLSPRDLCARDELGRMAEAGVYSFKIEGRLKRPEHVAVVTRAYRKALDSILEGRFSPMEAGERESLTQIFSRGGFTKGYLGNQRDAAIIEPGRVTPAGIVIGTVTGMRRKGGALLADVRLDKPLHDGDGLEIDGQGLIYAGPETPAGGNASLRLREAVRTGAVVRRTEDEEQLRLARASYEGEAFDRALPVPFDAECVAFPGEALTLRLTDGESSLTVRGEACPPAASKPLDETAVRRALEKTGGTPFVLRKLTVRTAGAFVPASALNALRRQGLAELAGLRIAAQPRPGTQPARFDAPSWMIPAPRLIAQTDCWEEIPDLLACGAEEVLFAPRDVREAALLPKLRDWPANARLCLPAQCREETLAALRAWAEQYGVPLCLSSPGQLGLGDMAGEGIPVMNGESIRLLASLGCKSVTLSRELSRREAEDLPAGLCEMILPVYGRTRLMLLNHCPARTVRRLEAGREACDLCARGQGADGACLRDRMGAEYPLLPQRLPEGCVISLMGSKPLHLSAWLKGLPPLSWLVTLTDETPERRRAIVAHYAALLRGETPPPLDVDGTAGRFRDGVQ